METVIVTGASGNLGSAVVQKFLSEDVQVIGTVHGELDRAPAHSRLQNVKLDLGNEAEVESFVSSILKTHKRIDAAVLTVGGFAMGNISEVKSSDIRQQYQLNFETAYNIARPVFLQMMNQKSGRIFLIGSKPGLDTRTSGSMVGYGLAKSLLFRLAEIFNEEAKGYNVVTSVIVPGTIDTPENRKSMPDADYRKWVAPAAIADVIYYYCTQADVIREPIIKVYGNG